MNKHFTQKTLRHLPLIIIALTSGCGQSSIIDSPKPVSTNSPEPSSTPTVVVASETATLRPCLFPPQASPSEFVKMADDWFQSSQPPILERSNYNPKPSEWTWDRFCKRYHAAILNQEYWINSPVETAIRVAGYPSDDYWYPDTVTAYYQKHSPFIVTVVIFTTRLLNDSVSSEEVRVDLVNVDGIWKIEWFGFRWLCSRDQTDEWVITLCP